MIGVYAVEELTNGEAVLRQDSVAFKIRKRREPGPNKPEKFLVMFQPAYRYISSLYPVEGNAVYALDCDNVPYTLYLGADTAEIKLTMPKMSER